MATRTDGNDAAFAARLRDFRDDLSAIENGEKYAMFDLLTDRPSPTTAMTVINDLIKKKKKHAYITE